MDQSKSIFETLFEINVNDHVEKKNGLSYLSWPYAWAEVKKRFPDANYKVYETESGCIYFTDGKTCWVKTGVEIAGLEHIEYLPIMDYKNKSISLENVTSFDVNKSIQRSLTKALARHGLGLYLYAGEDLPEIEIEKISAKVPLKEMASYSTSLSSITGGRSSFTMKYSSYEAAGKTGSAQYDDSDRYHSWFTGFAPYDNPQIAVCVILEGGYSGVSSAQVVAKTVFDTYFGY